MFHHLLSLDLSRFDCWRKLSYKFESLGANLSENVSVTYMSKPKCMCTVCRPLDITTRILSSVCKKTSNQSGDWHSKTLKAKVVPKPQWLDKHAMEPSNTHRLLSSSGTCIFYVGFFISDTRFPIKYLRSKLDYPGINIPMLTFHLWRVHTCIQFLDYFFRRSKHKDHSSDSDYQLFMNWKNVWKTLLAHRALEL